MQYFQTNVLDRHEALIDKVICTLHNIGDCRGPRSLCYLMLYPQERMSRLCGERYIECLEQSTCANETRLVARLSAVHYRLASLRRATNTSPPFLTPYSLLTHASLPSQEIDDFIRHLRRSADVRHCALTVMLSTESAWLEAIQSTHKILLGDPPCIRQVWQLPMLDDAFVASPGQVKTKRDVGIVLYADQIKQAGKEWDPVSLELWIGFRAIEEVNLARASRGRDPNQIGKDGDQGAKILSDHWLIHHGKNKTYLMPTPPAIRTKRSMPR